MKLTLVIPYVNQPDLTKTCYDLATKNSSEAQTNIMLLDNSDKPIGSYGVFKRIKEMNLDSEIIGVIHNDLFINEKGWDTRILNAFTDNPHLGLLGFVGSNEIDGSGGRGLGTTSNFLGEVYRAPMEVIGEPGGEIGVTPKIWTGSNGSLHGKLNEGLSNAAVLDGCAMIFRKQVLQAIPFREDYPIHHFYDRLMSCQVQEAGSEVAVLGIGCDHINGQTVNAEWKYYDATEKWFATRGMQTLEEVAARYGTTIPGNWDHANYLVAEKLWLNEYRDIKHFIPRKV